MIQLAVIGYNLYVLFMYLGFSLWYIKHILIFNSFKSKIIKKEIKWLIKNKDKISLIECFYTMENYLKQNIIKQEYKI